MGDNGTDNDETGFDEEAYPWSDEESSPLLRDAFTPSDGFATGFEDETMNIELTAPVSAILQGPVVSANDVPPDVPAPYTSGPLEGPVYVAPGLFKSEKAAFAALEGAMQEAEAIIYQGGCVAASGGGSRTWDISTFVDNTGTGFVEVSLNGELQFTLDVSGGALAGPPAETSFRVTGNSEGQDVADIVQEEPPEGTSFRVTGNELNVLNGNSLPFYLSTAHYSATGQMMTQTARFRVKNVNNLLDSLSGTAIKDFYKVGATAPIPVIYDWGLQSVSKNDIPQDKWWQRSEANRSDNFIGKTHFRKDRLFSAKSGGVCSIDILMEGTNDANLFDQTGTLTIKKAAPSPF
jgi:hypothetical protein